MTEAEYNVAEGIRRSDLWRMNDSPEKFIYFLEHPLEQSAAMAFGSACHKMILEGDDFYNEYAIAPQVDKRTKEGKAIWEAFATENAGKTIISQEDAEKMRNMKESIARCPLANELINGEHQTEVPIFWKDPETGEKCKLKLDVLRKEDGKYVIVDYKTTKRADTEHFNRTAFDFGYHFQAGFYTEGIMTALNLDYRPRFIFVAQEKDAPHSVNVIEVSDDVMRIGVSKFHELLQKYADCKAVDIWSGYVDDVPNETTVPGWYSIDEDDI